MWVTNNLGYDVELSGVHLYRASQQEVTEAQATALLANATYVLLKTNGQLVQTDSQPDANSQYYVRPLDGVITLNGFPSNPNGSPEVSPLEAFDIGKEEGTSDLENNKEATINVSTYTEPVEITPTQGKDGMKKATVTLDNIPSGADLEANKEATINVSTYTEPVEVTPTQGKDGMEKVTVTLSNIPSGGSDVPSVMNLDTYDLDALMLFDDKTKLSRLFTSGLSSGSGWIDDISQTFDSSVLGENGLLIGQNALSDNLPALCLEYDNKMYKAPASVSNYYEQCNFVEVQSQATPPTSDTPSGTVASGTIIHLSTTETGGTIYYSDGNVSFTGFTEYDDSNGIEITGDITIQAVVAVNDKFTSEYLELEFTIA